MLAIAFTGLARSGKDTAADFLVKEHGFRKLALSEVLAEELRKRGKQDRKMGRSLLAEELRKKHGDDVLARRVLRKALKNNWQRVVFTGIHAIAEVRFFRKNCGRLFLVAVKAGAEKRFARRSKLDAQSRGMFFARDRHDLREFELRKVIAAADYTIENNSTINDLHLAINEWFQKI